jgi:cytochrome c-type biogenesis protein CcmF
MVIHPPALYLGFVAATVPFAFGMAALASGRLDDKWLGSVRVWMLICWFFLSFGLILGGRWAYEELGWGGYWAWDPVENAGFLPWFTATAFLHSVIIQEQRSMMKVWNIVLVVLTFFLTIFGTFMTRSGVVQSVHAFGEDNRLALFFILFMAGIFISSFGLLIWRLPKLRSTGTFESFYSREFAFLLNNWILLGCAFFVLFATMYPTISEAFDGQRKTVGIPFFNKFMTPLGLVLLFLAGAAPLLAWRKTTRERLQAQFMIPIAAGCLTIVVLALAVPATLVSTPIFVDELRLPISLLNFGLVAFTVASIGQEFWKGMRVRRKQTGTGHFTSLIGVTLQKRRKYGGYVVHLGIALMFIGFAGKAYDTMQDYTVQGTGETFQVRRYTFRYDSLEVSANDNKRMVTAEVGLYTDIDRVFYNAITEGIVDAKVGLKQSDIGLWLPNSAHEADMTPARWRFFKGDQTTTEVYIKSMLNSEDVYLVLTGYNERSKVANFRVYVNPLINWVWLGFLFLALGTALCLFPQRWVDNMSPTRRTRMGRNVEVAVLLLAIGTFTFGAIKAARADQPAGTASQPKAEYTDTPAHNDGVSYAHRCRPDTPTARRLMKNMVCLCGGCKRESLFECRCGRAAQDRCRILEQLSRMGGISKTEVDEKAYEKVRESFLKQYGERVLANPTSKLSWALPLAAIGGAFILLFGLTRHWVHRGKKTVKETADVFDDEPEDDEYADLLDDELRETD